MKYSKEEKRQLVDSYNSWWHSIDFGDGVISKGRKTNIQGMLEELNSWSLNEASLFKNKTVLDIGAWDGYYSFHAERSGASSVSALDGFIWLDKSWGSKTGFDISKKIFNSNVNEIVQDVMDMTPETTGTYDFIICAGVLYHLHNPMLALELISRLLNPGGSLFIETTCARVTSSSPIMEYHPSDSLDGDKSNFWSMNTDCLKYMLIDSGSILMKFRCIFRSLGIFG